MVWLSCPVLFTLAWTDADICALARSVSIRLAHIQLSNGTRTRERETERERGKEEKEKARCSHIWWGLWEGEIEQTEKERWERISVVALSLSCRPRPKDMTNDVRLRSLTYPIRRLTVAQIPPSFYLLSLSAPLLQRESQIVRVNSERERRQSIFVRWKCQWYNWETKNCSHAVRSCAYENR